MEQWPILAEGAPIGWLRTEQEGLYTRFRGEAVWEQGVLRLWVFGDGTQAYVGVMVPDGAGKVRLNRSFSATDLRGFPEPILSAGPEERTTPMKEEIRTGTEVPEIAEVEEDTLWYAYPDGSLTTFDGRRNLIAFPAGDARIPRGAEGLLRTIDGETYLIFPE